MSDGAGCEVEVSSEGGSNAERFEEAASQVEEGAAEQAERGTAVPAIPAWSAELLEQLAEGETFSARDQTRLQLGLSQYYRYMGAPRVICAVVVCLGKALLGPFGL